MVHLDLESVHRPITLSPEVNLHKDRGTGVVSFVSLAGLLFVSLTVHGLAVRVLGTGVSLPFLCFLCVTVASLMANGIHNSRMSGYYWVHLLTISTGNCCLVI